MLEYLVAEDDDFARKLRVKHMGTDAPITGDPLVDLWNRQITRGEEPDLTLDEPENAKKHDEWLRKRSMERAQHTSFAGPGDEGDVYGNETPYKQARHALGSPEHSPNEARMTGQAFDQFLEESHKLRGEG